MPDDVALDIFGGARAATPAPTAKSAVLAAFKLLTGADDGQVPHARSRTAIDAFAAQRDGETAKKARLNVPGLIDDALNWNIADGEPKRTTKTVIKSIGKAMLGEVDGRGTYAQAVEALSFCAAYADLIEPDRAARVLARAMETPNAYRPIRTIGSLNTDLRTILERYPEARRERLLISLWDQSHDGRWWEHTYGPATDGRRIRRARRDIDADAVGDALDEQMARRRLDAETVLQAADARQLVMSHELCELMRDVRMSRAQELAAMRLCRDEARDPEQHVLFAYAPLAPDARPDSPIPQMVERLVRIFADPHMDVEELDRYRENPEEWSDLYPEAGLTRYPYSDAVYSLHNTTRDGVTIEVIRNDAALRANADYMGNCTFSYANRCAQGTYVILRLIEGQNVHNASFVSNGGGWRIGEINSRYNGGGVPANITNLANALCQAL